MSEKRARFAERITWLKHNISLTLSSIIQHHFSPQDTRGNIENFIGSAAVPVGLAGPLKINGDHAKGDFFIPLATKEGALVASYNRGMKIISDCGGANVKILKELADRYGRNKNEYGSKNVSN